MILLMIWIIGGEPTDFSVEEITDMDAEGEVQMNLPYINNVCEVQSDLANIDCVGQDELCKVVLPNNPEPPKQDTIQSKINSMCDNKSHGELFCVTGKDSDPIDIDDLY